MSSIQKIGFREVSRPLRIDFSTSLGSKNLIRSVLLKVRLSDGNLGEGEIPTSFAFPHETIPAILRFLQEITPMFLQMPIDDYRDRIDNLRRLHPDFPMTISGLEVALFRAWLRNVNKDELDFWGGKTKSCHTDITIPFVSDFKRLSIWLDRSMETGFNIFKIKTGGDYRKDLSYIQWIEDILKVKCEHHVLRLDGNQGYNPDSLSRLIETCDARNFPIDAIEQPLPAGDMKGLREIRGKASFPVILDEGVKSESDLNRVLEAAWCDGVNIKIAKSGIEESRRIMRLARRCGLRLMIGCMTETMTGLSAAICMAAGTGIFDFVDLDSIHFLFHKKRYGRIELNGPNYIL